MSCKSSIRSQKLRGNTNAKSTLRRVDVGWKHVEGGQLKQIRKKTGGGTEKLKCRFDETVRKVKQKAIECFFPDGKSQRGWLANRFKLSMVNYDGRLVNENETIGDLYEKTGVKMLRLYLRSEYNTEQSSCLVIASDEPLIGCEAAATAAAAAAAAMATDTTPDAELSVDELSTDCNVDLMSTCTTTNSLASKDGPPANCDPVIMPTSTTTGSVSFTEQSSTNLTARMSTSTTTVDLHAVSVNRPSTICNTGTMDPSCTTGAAPDNVCCLNEGYISSGLLEGGHLSEESLCSWNWSELEALLNNSPSPAPSGDSTTNHVATPSSQLPLTISIEILDPLTSMIDAFKNPNILNAKLSVSVSLTNGKKKKSESPTVIKDCICRFWYEFYSEATEGVHEKVPCLRPEFKEDDWQSVGRIFVYGWKSCDFLPTQLSKAFVSKICGETPNEERLIDSFFNYVAGSKRKLLGNALSAFDAVDRRKLICCLHSFSCKTMPSPTNIKGLIRDIAYQEMIQQPMFIIINMEKILQEEEADTITQIRDYYKILSQSPTS